MSDSLGSVKSWRSWADASLRWAGPVVGVGVGRGSPSVLMPTSICSTPSPSSGSAPSPVCSSPTWSCIRGGVGCGAVVVRRRVRDQIPRALAGSLVVQAVLLVVLLGIAVGTASVDGAGRAGRALVESCQGAPM